MARNRYVVERIWKLPEENLAVEEALLEWCAAGSGGGGEVLRLWEPESHFVVLGRSNRAAAEVDLDLCERLGVPVLRRCSGGGAVLQGPGCLNYALILSQETSTGLATVTGANREIMQVQRRVLFELTGEQVTVEGVTDLAINGMKVSGNAQKRGRSHLLFHGSFLLNLDLDLMGRVLRMPTRRPAYRQDRAHGRFVRNLGVSVAEASRSLCRAWGATRPLALDLDPLVGRWMRERYGDPDWHRKLWT